MTLSHIGPAALHDRVVTLSDGHRVGVTVGGHGVPLVFLHGIAMNRFAYTAVLEQAAESGYFVIAIDAPSHGETDPLPSRNDSWEARVAFVDRVLDELGVRRAAIAGHSMGGRKAVALAALNPARAAAIVLVSAATGSAFDHYKVQPGKSPAYLLTGLALAFYDTVVEQVELRGPGVMWGWCLTRSLVKNTVRQPLWFVDVARSIIQDAQGAAHLESVRSSGLPVFVLHGRRDQVIRYSSAVSASEATQGMLIELPRARHSWLIGSPQTFVAVMTNLLENELGELLDTGGRSSDKGIHGEPTGWLDPSGLAYEVAGGPVRPRRPRKRSVHPPLVYVRPDTLDRHGAARG